MKYLIVFLFVSSLTIGQDFSKFTSKPLNSSSSFQYYESKYFTYSSITENNNDSLISKAFVAKSIESYLSQAQKVIFDSNKISIENKLLLHSFLSISNFITKWEAIKYRTVMAKDTSSYIVLVLKSENQKIMEDTLSITSSILKNILKLNSDVFPQFEYENPTKKYTELAKIVKEVKDPDGTLNLDKLSIYIKTNPKELAKYCDF